jgi:hypothetical protein
MRVPVLTRRRESIRMSCRLAAIGAAVLCLAGGLAFVAGWPTPGRLTAPRIIDTFEANGDPTVRRYAGLADG